MSFTFRKLYAEEISKLENQGCTAENWDKVSVAEKFNPENIRNTSFSGTIRIGLMEKQIILHGDIKKSAGIYSAQIHNCSIGSNVYISNIGSYIANYTIEDDVVISNTGVLEVDGESSFGNGTEVKVVNEAGGREIPVFDHLSSHVACIIAFYRHNRSFIKNIKKLIAAYTVSMLSNKGLVSKKAKIINCGILRNIRVGKYAVLEGVSRLNNGTINSSKEDPAYLGTDVIADNFIISSGANVNSGVILSNCFVGQAAELSKQFSAENSVFFANCSAYYGEACSIFAGPFTVTHHKSTLLIAGVYSFFNAGSGTNQSNHMYKLGPVHQGIMERGAKTASDAYLLWPARIGPFTFIKGRHYSNLNTADFPFSYLIEREGKSELFPGVGLRSIAPVRDSRKWAQRDKRKDPKKYDFIIYNYLTPYTVQKMDKGLEILKKLKAEKSSAFSCFSCNGIEIRESSLKNGIKIYSTGIDKYIGDIVIKNVKRAVFKSITDIRSGFSAINDAGKTVWLDIAGLPAPAPEIDKVIADIEQGKIVSHTEVNKRFREIYEFYPQYELSWAAGILEKKYGKKLIEFTAEDFIQIIERWLNAVEVISRMQLSDAEKEFNLSSQIGYGLFEDSKCSGEDFKAVRGGFEDDSFIIEIKAVLKNKKKNAFELIEKLKKIAN